ncbi:hypothetical protein SAMN04487995_1347 [Dyadobacter koreensis]|uniref:Uncharacterized protein n=1 Tax=Dyadobacter koreensis TaxID=408657 RepID=A0A1H6RJ35_9BACT|nr:hypothetical protein [Dyadobacter koreensis]SEI55808.1 hypothetical protein SAMN04487995_1347 [Dyadobacter koreensis]
MASRNRKFPLSLETSLSILAVVSSFCAIGITLYQVYLQRIEHYAAALPYLMVSITNFSEDSTPEYTLEVSNKGVGLAKIEKLDIWYKKKKVENENALIRALITNDTTTSRVFSSLWKGRVISPGEQFNWIKLSGPGAQSLRNEIDKGNIEYRILFSSIYDEKWYFNSISGKRLIEVAEE